MRNNIKEINKAIYSWWINLPDRSEKYTNPYLIMPSKAFMDAKRKLVVFGKETNGWAQCEQEEEKLIFGEDIIWSAERLEQFYEKKVNGKTIGPNPFWNFCWELESSIMSADSDIGICYANISLLGKPYGERGYDMNLAGPLSHFLAEYLDTIKPDAILCLTGFGTKTRTELPYLKILEQNVLFGQYDRENDLFVGNTDIKYPLRKLAFKNAQYPIYGTVHPERKSREWKKETIRSILLAVK